MTFNHLTHEEKLVAQLLEDADFRKEHLALLKTSKFTNPELHSIVQAMDEKKTFISILNGTNSKTLAYAMHLANAIAEVRIRKPFVVNQNASEEEKLELMIQTLTEEERPLADSAPFKRCYEEFKKMGKPGANHEDYLNSWNDWRSYVTLILGA